MAFKIFQILRGTQAVKPTLKDGQMYLETDKDTVVCQNGTTEIRFANESSVTSLSTEVGTLATNVASLNTEIDNKLDTPTGTSGQLLGFTSNNVVGAVNAISPSTTTPKAAGTAAVGTSTNYARADHVHPSQTSVSGNAGTATRLATARTLTIGSTGKTFNGSSNVSWSLSEIGAASTSDVDDLDTRVTTLEEAGGGGAFTNSATGTLSTSWTSTSSTPSYYQQITISGMTADATPLVFPQWSSTASTKTSEQTAWNTIQPTVESFAGYVRFYTNATTSTAVSFKILW